MAGETTCFSVVKLCAERKSSMKSPTVFSLSLIEGIWTMDRWKERSGDDEIIEFRCSCSSADDSGSGLSFWGET